MNDTQKKLLEAIRAGKDTKLGWDDIAEVLPLMGGKFEKAPVYDKNAFNYIQLKSKGSDLSVEKDIEQLRREVSKLIVKKPAPPSEEGQIVITDVSPIVSHESHDGSGVTFMFRFGTMVAVPGYVVSLGGKSHATHPDFSDIRFDYLRRRLGTASKDDDLQTQFALMRAAVAAFSPQSIGYKYRPDKARAFLRKQGWKDKAVELLGTGAYVPVVRQSKSGSGICGACFGEFKVRNGLMVLHGFLRPGTGYLVGRCVGSKCDPFEVSPEGTKEHLLLLENIEKRERRHLDDLINNPPASIAINHGTSRRPNFVEHPAGSMDYILHLKGKIRMVENTIKQLEKDIPFYEFVIRSWHPRPLLVPGQQIKSVYAELMDAYRGR